VNAQGGRSLHLQTAMICDAKQYKRHLLFGHSRRMDTGREVCSGEREQRPARSEWRSRRKAV
jgi:hypothetical protein